MLPLSAKSSLRNVEKIKRSKWKGARLRNMHLISFDPTRPLPFTVDGSEKTERELFEAFWLIYKIGDQPNAEQVRQSLKIRDLLEAKSVAGGSIKLAACAACGQRIARHDDIRTLPEGDAVLNLRLEDKDFKYIQDCFGKWNAVTAELRRYFGHVQDLFETSKSMSLDELDALIAKAAAASA